MRGGLNLRGMGTTEFFLEVSKGNIEGHFPWTVQGRREEFDVADGFVDVWSCVPFTQIRLGLGAVEGGPTVAAETVSIVSDSALDTGSVLLLEGLNSAGYRISELVVMTGLTPVVSLQSFSTVHRLIQLFPISPTVRRNVGTITATFSISLNAQCCMIPGFCISNNCQFRVPAGETLFVLKTYLESSKTSGGQYPVIEFEGRVTQFGSELVGLNEILDTSIGERVPLDFPLVLPIFEGSDIVLQVNTDRNGTRVRTFLWAVSVDNDLL